MRSSLEQAARVIAAQPWLALATIAASGAPYASYVPFACVDGAFGIVVSRLAQHTEHLVARQDAAILIVENAPDAADPFARRRVSIDVRARPAAVGSPRAAAIWTALATRHGATVEMLRTLPDFGPIALEPVRGRLVLGFAAAFDLDEATLMQLIRAAA